MRGPRDCVHRQCVHAALRCRITSGNSVLAPLADDVAANESAVASLMFAPLLLRASPIGAYNARAPHKSSSTSTSEWCTQAVSMEHHSRRAARFHPRSRACLRTCSTLLASTRCTHRHRQALRPVRRTCRCAIHAPLRDNKSPPFRAVVGQTGARPLGQRGPAQAKPFLLFRG